MNDENIAELIIELDKLAPLVPPGNHFTSEWLMNEYTDVTKTRNNGWQTYKNEYRIIKLLIDARTKVLLRNRDKLELFVPAFNIMKSIEDALKEEFEARKHGKSIISDLANIAAMMS